jgi:4-carboxymuconolactone decarboxylase
VSYFCLLRGSFSGPHLPELIYRQAVAAFGQHGATELIYLVGLYCLVSVTLNGFDVPVPQSEPQ